MLDGMEKEELQDVDNQKVIDVNAGERVGEETDRPDFDFDLRRAVIEAEILNPKYLQ